MQLRLLGEKMENGVPIECVPKKVYWNSQARKWETYSSSMSGEPNLSMDPWNPYPLTGRVRRYPCFTAEILDTEEFDIILGAANIRKSELDCDLNYKMRVIQTIHQLNVELSSWWETLYKASGSDLLDNPIWRVMGQQLWMRESWWKRAQGKRKQIFCDLDGVLVDFQKGVNDVFKGRSYFKGNMWPALASTPGFYENLSWTKDGLILWEKIRELNPVILSGVPKGKWASPQKKNWVRSQLGVDVQVITCEPGDKCAYCPLCPPGSILIDNRQVLKDGWEAVGGIFILHRDAKSTIRELKRLGVLPYGQVPMGTGLHL